MTTQITKSDCVNLVSSLKRTNQTLAQRFPDKPAYGKWRYHMRKHGLFNPRKAKFSCRKDYQRSWRQREGKSKYIAAQIKYLQRVLAECQAAEGLESMQCSSAVSAHKAPSSIPEPTEEHVTSVASTSSTPAQIATPELRPPRRSATYAIHDITSVSANAHVVA